MNRSNKTGNFSNFQYNMSVYEHVILVLYNSPKYVMSMGIVGNVISLFIFTRPCLNSKTNIGKLYTFLCGLSLIMIVYNMESPIYSLLYDWINVS